MFITVIGAGVVGMTTAVCLQRRYPSAEIKVVADKFLQDTTSYGAAGIFRPTKEKAPDVPLDLLRRWLRHSWQYLNELVKSEEASKAGILIRSGYIFTDEKPTEDPLFAEFVYSYRRCTPEEMAMFKKKFRYGWQWTTLICECRKYLPYLMKKFVMAGGRFEKRHVRDLVEFADETDLLVNCSGLGSRFLLNDLNVKPIRGHIIQVKAPWLSHAVHFDPDGTFLIPCSEFVAICGTRQVNDFETCVRADERDAILKRVYELIPSLKDAPTIGEWVGHRPFRSRIRLETEILRNCTGSQLKIIHNYGHGAEGVSLAYGTAMEVVDVATRFLTSKLQSKL